ncbi:MAG: tRNA dihydrouridine synthase [Lachnospiraceae bacterium]
MKKTYYYLAPMEGITGYVYRSAHHKIFPGADKYFTPFITPNQTRKLTSRELNDILPKHNQGMKTIPQIMTNRAEDFIWAAMRCSELGYQEINLNLGCPSGTVVAKGRGSGFLAEPLALDRFLCRVSTELDRCGIRFSIKTRIGKDDPEEFEDLLAIYNRYPLEELIIHPRIQRDFYKNHPNMEIFAQAFKDSRNPVCYNGDLFNRELCRGFLHQQPDVSAVMLGRGVIANPALITELTTGEGLNKDRLAEFHELVLEGYREVIPGDRNVLFKMKELWFYLGGSFTDSSKHVKKIRKAGNILEYRLAAQRLFEELTLGEPAGYENVQGKS